MNRRSPSGTKVGCDSPSDRPRPTLGGSDREVRHSGRFALMLAAGRMPRVDAGGQEGDHTYFSVGATLTLGIGSAEP